MCLHVRFRCTPCAALRCDTRRRTQDASDAVQQQQMPCRRDDIHFPFSQSFATKSYGCLDSTKFWSLVFLVCFCDNIANFVATENSLHFARNRETEDSVNDFHDWSRISFFLVSQFGLIEWEFNRLRLFFTFCARNDRFKSIAVGLPSTFFTALMESNNPLIATSILVVPSFLG